LHTQFFHDVLPRLHQLCALPDQRMAAARQRRMDGTGNGEYLAPKLRRQPCGNQRATLFGRFDHQHALRQPGHNAVALWKVIRQRFGSQRILGHQRPAIFHDAMRQLQIGRRIHDVQPGAHHRHG